MEVRDGRGKPKFLEGDGREFNTERKTSPEHQSCNKMYEHLRHKPR